jgi:hypothetical protein
MKRDIEAREWLGAPEGEDEEDPLVEECVSDALAPYVGVLSPEELTDHRRFLILFITTHPAAAPLYRRLRQRPPLSESGEISRDTAASDQDVGSPRLQPALSESGEVPRDGAATEDAPPAWGDGKLGGSR